MQTTKVDLDGLHLHVTSMMGSTACRYTPHPGTDLIILPLRWEGEMRWNGELIERPTLLRYAEYFACAATDMEVIGLGFARTRVEDAATALGVESAKLVSGCGPIPSDHRYGEPLMHTLRMLGQLATSAGPLFESASFRRSARALLIRQVVELYAHSSGHADRAIKRRRKQLRCVQRAEECFDAAPYHRVSLSDLCAAAGVSARCLQYAFRDIYGMSPTQYFKARKLAAARTRLRKAQPEAGAVKRAALESGLNELGRFSVEYREFFGETPSATLSRSAS